MPPSQPCPPPSAAPGAPAGSSATTVAPERDPRARAAALLAGDGARELFEVATAEAGARLVDTSLRSIHQRAGRSVTHVHEARLEVAGEVQEVLLVAHLDRRTFPEGAFVLRRGADEVAVWRFPYDPYLPGLPSALDAGRVRELLDGLGAAPGQVHLRTRAYRPTRRGVVEVTIDGPEAAGRVLYLKVFTGDRATELAEVHRQLHVAGLGVPRVIGVAAAQGILALEALPGPTLRAALVAGSPLPDPVQLVAVSERFAASGLVAKRDPRAFADPLRHVEVLAGLVPDRAAEVADLAAAAAAVDGPLVPVHGDLHDGQLLLTGEQVTGILDVDGSGTGLVAQDAGNLVAHVTAVGEVWPEVAGRAAAYADALADAYRPLVGAEALARATAGGWLALATGPHRSQDEGWQAATHRRIDRAAASLAGRV